MTLNFGLHSGPQNIDFHELKQLWKRADEAGFYWVSVWDHFYANPISDRNIPCFEAIAAMAALALTTQKVRVGCLVFAMPFRQPGQLAKAVATIDHLSDGRAELGLGAGWLQEEFDEYGFPFPSIGKRLDRLEEGIQVIRSLFQDPVTDFDGQFYQLRGAICAPKPKQSRLRIWVGGTGRRRTPRLAARYGDGFNTAMLSPKDFQERSQTVDRFCEEIGRDPGEITRTVNLGFYMAAEAGDLPTVERQAAVLTEEQRQGVLLGTPRQVIDRIGEYVQAGAQGVNISMRPPVDHQALEAFIAEVMPRFA